MLEQQVWKNGTLNPKLPESMKKHSAATTAMTGRIDYFNKHVTKTPNELYRRPSRHS